MTEKVAQEVLDMEETFGFFREAYGEGAMDVIRCNLCGISHKSIHTYKLLQNERSPWNSVFCLKRNFEHL